MSFRLAPCLLFALVTTAFGQSATVDIQAEAAKLRAAAESKAKEIGKLTASGNLTSSDDSLKLLQQMVDDLRDIRERLRTLEEQVTTQGKTTATLSQTATKVKWGGYIQFQYQDTDRVGFNQFDAFRLRRVRLGLDANTSPRVGGRISFDLGTATNQTQAQLRDAWIWYDFSGSSHLGRDRAYAGQIPFMLGYELERSSAEREMPERAQYNQILFQTERSRGVKIRREGRDGLLQAGVLDALTINDPEQANLAPGAGDRLAAVAQARLIKGNTSVGISGMAGDRPEFTAAGVTSPKVPRRFGYLDFEQRHLLLNGLTLRGELMRGTDRLPSATAAVGNVEHPLSGYHLIGNYKLSSLDQVAVRWEGFDPNLDAGGNALHGYGVAYIRNLTPEMRLTLGHEIFVDEARAALGQARYGVTTLRLQVRF